jgi:chromate transporter
VSEPPARPAALFLGFLRLGATAFGGPAMVHYIGELAVVRKRWLSREEFREGAALCQSIPGATAMQTAAYVGLRAGGARGAAAAYAGFALPAALLMLAASVAYGRASGLAAVQATFRGFHAVIVALAANSALRFGRANVRSGLDAVLVLACALALQARAGPATVIAGAALVSIILRRRGTSNPAPASPGITPRVGNRTIVALLAGGAAALLVLLAIAPRLGALAAICMKVDALAFGGGFASVPLMYREIVTSRSWIDAKTFMDGIALGQVTPGPIVITATFVGYQVGGLAGALVATAAIFFPSFVLVLVAAPSFSALRVRPWFEPGLHGALLSFVGLLVFVTLQFAGAVDWTVGAGILAAVALAALLAGIDVLWVVLGAGGIAAIAL